MKELKLTALVALMLVCMFQTVCGLFLEDWTRMGIGLTVLAGSMFAAGKLERK